MNGGFVLLQKGGRWRWQHSYHVWRGNRWCRGSHREHGLCFRAISGRAYRRSGRVRVAPLRATRTGQLRTSKRVVKANLADSQSVLHSLVLITGLGAFSSKSPSTSTRHTTHKTSTGHTLHTSNDHQMTWIGILTTTLLAQCNTDTLRSAQTYTIVADASNVT